MKRIVCTVMVALWSCLAIGQVIHEKNPLNRHMRADVTTTNSALPQTMASEIRAENAALQRTERRTEETLAQHEKRATIPPAKLLGSEPSRHEEQGAFVSPSPARRQATNAGSRHGSRRGHGIRPGWVNGR